MPIDTLDLEIINAFHRLFVEDPVKAGAAIVLADALAAGTSEEDALALGNSYLVKHNRKPEFSCSASAITKHKGV